MADVASRKGTIGTTDIKLAAWLEPNERYQRRYRPIQPLVERASAGEVLFNADPSIRTWIIRDWSLGEGEEGWVPGAYNEADGVRPIDPGKGLILIREPEREDPGSADELHVFGLGQGSLWIMGATIANPTAWEWTEGASAWAAGVTVTGAGGNFTSVADGSGAGSTDMFAAATNNKIIKFNGAASTHYDTGTGDDWTNDPLLVAFGGNLYGLDGDDLYDIDMSTTDTRTLKVDLQGNSSAFLAKGYPWPQYSRLAVSDKGPIWIQRLNSGETYIWEYNEASDTEERIGRLPIDFANPSDLYFANGFYFVAFRNSPAASGEAFLFIFRGGQQAIIGPIRARVGSDLSDEMVKIGGVIGDDLIFLWDDTIWAYNLTTGGVFQVAIPALTTPSRSIITFGNEIFVHRNSSDASRFRHDLYLDSGTNTIQTGRHDFEYPGLRKRLLDVTVVTDPLPAATSVTAAVAVDGGSFTALTGTHDTDNNVRYTWAASTSSADFVGYEFEIQLTLATTNTSNTPTIRQVNATAASAAYRREWVLGVDVSDLSHVEIDNLNALVDGGVVTFTDPWQNRESDASDTFNVIVEEVQTPEVRSPQTPDQLVAFMRLRDRDLVSGTGGSA